MRGHFASEIEGGHLDPSRRYCVLSWLRNNFLSLTWLVFLVGVLQGDSNARRNSKTETCTYLAPTVHMENSSVKRAFSIAYGNNWKIDVSLRYVKLYIQHVYEIRRTSCFVHFIWAYVLTGIKICHMIVIFIDQVTRIALFFQIAMTRDRHAHSFSRESS